MAPRKRCQECGEKVYRSYIQKSYKGKKAFRPFDWLCLNCNSPIGSKINPDKLEGKILPEQRHTVTDRKRIILAPFLYNDVLYIFGPQAFTHTELAIIGELDCYELSFDDIAKKIGVRNSIVKKLASELGAKKYSHYGTKNDTIIALYESSFWRDDLFDSEPIGKICRLTGINREHVRIALKNHKKQKTSAK